MTDTEKCEEAKKLLQEWLNKQGHDRCWYYPEIFRPLCALFGVEPPIEPGRVPLEEFKEGCTRYQKEEYVDGS